MSTAYDLAFVRKEEEPILDPPVSNAGAVAWLRGNLLSSPTNVILTILGVLLIVWVVPPLVRWAFIDAVWTGTGRADCAVPGAGACWAFVRAKFAQFMYGRYPIEERWRVDLTGILLVIGLIPMALPRVPYKRENAIYLLVIFPIVALILLTGGHFGFSWGAVLFLALLGCLLTGAVAIFAVSDAEPLWAGLVAPAAVLIAVLAFIANLTLTLPVVTIAGMSASIGAWLVAVAALVALFAALRATFGARSGRRSILSIWIAIAALVGLLVLLSLDFGLTFVETTLWGGLLVTLVVAIVGIVSSLPIGIVLALGRRSKLPIVRFASIAFIEFVRGVPLITVLFMASVMFPLFLPPGVNFDRLLRALIGVSLFSGAYMAEVIRGGLQAIPKGQVEAANALGLNYWRTMRLIVLPQALKIVIPGIVNSFISLFKDTSLVAIIAIFDLLKTVESNFTDANWAGPTIAATGYVFVAVVFWLFCFGMSRYSIYTERRLDTGHRR